MEWFKQRHAAIEQRQLENQLLAQQVAQLTQQNKTSAQSSKDTDAIAAAIAPIVSNDPVESHTLGQAPAPPPTENGAPAPSPRFPFLHKVGAAIEHIIPGQQGLEKPAALQPPIASAQPAGPQSAAAIPQQAATGAAVGASGPPMSPGWSHPGKPYTTDDWQKERDLLASRIKKAGGSPSAVVEGQAALTKFQMGKFQEYGKQAYNALTMGNTDQALALIQHAYQYMPTRNHVVFKEGEIPGGTSATGQPIPPHKGLFAGYANEKTGELQGANPLSAQDLLGYLQNFSDPVKWLTLTHDMSVKDRGAIIAGLNAQSKAATAGAAQKTATARQTAAQAAMLKAQKTPNPNEVKQISVKDADAELDRWVKADQLSQTPSPVPSAQDRSAITAAAQAIVDNSKRKGVAVPYVSALQAAFQYWQTQHAAKP